MTHLLDVYFREAKAGALSRDDAGRCSASAYDAGYLDRGLSRAQSPFPCRRRRPPYGDGTVRPFFSGLLPDEGARQRLAGALGISAGNAFGLLESRSAVNARGLCRSIQPVQTPPSSDDDGVEVSRARSGWRTSSANCRERPLLGGEEGVRLSLAGAQDKLAVCVEGREHRARQGRPPDHAYPEALHSGLSTARLRTNCSACAWLRG